MMSIWRISWIAVLRAAFARTERARGLDLSIFTTRQVTRL